MDPLKMKLKAFALHSLYAFLAILGGSIGLPSIQIGYPKQPQQMVPMPVPTAPVAPQIIVTPPTPAPASPLKPVMENPLPAIGQISIGRFRCTGTLIAPIHDDGTCDVLCAAHCQEGTNGRGTMVLENGMKFAVRTVAKDSNTDCLWMVAGPVPKDAPLANLADDLPKEGEGVWHAGYGEHKPRNREDGKVVTPEVGSGKTEYLLSVSHGDSGGAIVQTSTGRVLSSVCCAWPLNQKGRVFGCSIRSILKLRPKHQAFQSDCYPGGCPQLIQ